MAQQAEIDDGNDLDFVRQVIRAEGESLLEAAANLDDAVCLAAQLILRRRGNVIVTGMGKAGLIGQKIAATLSSTGTPSHFLHPAEAVHGDLGRLQPDDVVLALSKSGETAELNQLLSPIADMQLPIVAITGSRASTLGKAAEIVIELGSVQEACPLRLAPTTSTTLMLALGDALALLVSRSQNFRREDFGRRHPAGMLGWELSTVEQYMRPLNACRVADEAQSVRRVFVSLGRPGRRSGAILLTNHEGKLVGLFTDSDLARVFEHGALSLFDQPIRELMTRNPLTVSSGASMRDAVDVMSNRQISELPVIDPEGRPIGLLDVTDLIGVTSRKDFAVEGGPLSDKKVA